MFDVDIEQLTQDLELSKEVAKKVFSPKFIPFYPSIKEEYDLSYLETLLYGFIDFYLHNSSDKFYFTNQQLADMFGVGYLIISKSIINLNNKKLIKTNYELRNKGGKVRFIQLLQKYKSDYYKSNSPTITKVIENNNKINNNKIEREPSQKSNQNKDLLLNLPEPIIQEMITKFNCSKNQVIEKAEALHDWSLSSGKNKKDWIATLRNALRKDYGKKKSYFDLVQEENPDVVFY